VVHSIRLVLADRAFCAGHLPSRLAPDTAAAYFRHCRSRSFELDQCFVPSSREIASRPTRHLTPLCLPINYSRVNTRISC